MKRRLQEIPIVVMIMLLLGKTAYASIDRIEGLPSCNGVKVVYASAIPKIAEVFGNGVDFANQVTISGSGVSVALLGKKNGAENQLRGKGFIGSAQIQFIANTSAAAGNRTVTIKYPNGQQDTFTVKVIKQASFTNATAPAPAGPFQEVEVTCDGSGLLDATLTASVTSFTGGSGGSMNVTNVNRITNTDTRVVYRLTLSQTASQATLELKLVNNAGCSPLNAFTSGLKRNLTITAPAGTNFVTSITFPFGRKFKVGDVAKVRVTLEHAVTTPAGDVVYWQLEPATAFTQASGGSNYNPSLMNWVTIPQGSNLADLSFQIASCPSSCEDCTVYIKTWRVNTASTQAPYFKQAPFNVICQQ